MAFIKGQGEHGMRRSVAHIDARPAVATIVTAQQHANFALEAASCRYPQLARSTWHLADVAAIDLTLGIQRIQRDVPPVVATVGAVKHTSATNAIDRAGTPTTDQYAMHVDS